ncbi:MAG: hypothetical protein F4X97_11610 [Boseongicola sp. SB0662_bin_57]|nr:hypothetical protein [Boseongicola sp. SB0662_bin_57]
MEAWLLHLGVKGRRANLDAAFDQLRQYALALENPPLLIVSDMERFRIRTNWSNSVGAMHEFALGNLADGATRDKLRQECRWSASPVKTTLGGRRRICTVTRWTRSIPT